MLAEPPSVGEEETLTPLQQTEIETRNLIKELDSLSRKALAKAFRAGELLQSLKKQINHGEWTEYLKCTLGVQPRTASNYMRLFNERESLEDDSGQLLDVGIVEALSLLRGDANAPEDCGDQDEDQETGSEEEEIVPDSSAETEGQDEETGGAEVTSPESDSDDDAESPQENDDSPSKCFTLADGTSRSPRGPWEEAYPLRREQVHQALTSFASVNADTAMTARKQQLLLDVIDAVNERWGSTSHPLTRADLQEVFNTLSKQLLDEQEQTA